MPERSSPLRSMQGWHWPWRAPQALWWGPSGLWHATGAGQAAPTRWDDLDAWCAAHAGQRATLWLSAWWVVDVLVDAALPLPDDAALLAHVRPLLQHYHGDAAAPWPLAAWQSGRARGASALHGLSLSDVQHTAQRHGVRLTGLQPWWARALRLALQHEPALAREPAAQLAVVEGRLVTRLDLARGHLVGLQQRRLPQATTTALRDWLADEPVAVQRCLGHGLVDDLAASPSTRQASGLPRFDEIALGTLQGPVPAPAWWAEASPARAGGAPRAQTVGSAATASQRALA